MHYGNLPKFGAAIALCGTLLSACGDIPTNLPADPLSTTHLQAYERPVGAPSPLRCPSNQTFTSTAIITPLGGVVAVGGVTISLPLGAVRLPTLITVTVPASQYMEIDIRAADLAHFIFQQPVTVSIDYSRCDDRRIDRASLAVWYWNAATGELLENMNGIDDELSDTMTFSTSHLSGYVIAN